MFIFRSKRTSLTKRLWKAKIKKQHEGGSKAKTLRANYQPADFDLADESSFRNNVLKNLKESQLEMLTFAVENGEDRVSGCVVLPKGLVEDTHVKCCQAWRWPDIHPDELKQFPLCASAKDPSVTCCNPYHWSRICQPETPPPPYQRYEKERLKPEDRAPSEGAEQLELRESCATEDEPYTVEWCRLAYWELSRRVGRQYAVIPPAINVFWNMPQGSGLCLEALASQFSPPETVKRARDKIGRGMTLSLEADGVWAYNRSEIPIFVNSPTLDDLESRTVLVYRVPPGQCLNIYVPGAPVRGPDPLHPTGPIDKYSIRISFAKGWGPRYSRQEITNCPTWLEVLLAPFR